MRVVAVLLLVAAAALVAANEAAQEEGAGAGEPPVEHEEGEEHEEEELPQKGGGGVVVRFLEAPPGMVAEEVARAVEAVLGSQDPVVALKVLFDLKKQDAAASALPATVRVAPPRHVPPRGAEHLWLPCQPKRSVSIARFLAVGADGLWVRPLPVLTPAYSLTYSVLMLPGDTWRLLHVFGNSHALYSNSSHFKLACSSAVAVPAEQELVYTVKGRQSLVGQWVGIAAIVDGERLVLIVDQHEELTFDCRPRFPVSGLFIGATAAQADYSATRALFANVKYHNYNLHGEENLVEPVLLELPASVDMTRDPVQAENEEEEEEDEVAVLDAALTSPDLEVTRKKMGERGGRGDAAAMSVLGVLHSLGVGGLEHAPNRSLAWHLLSVAADKSGGHVLSCAALARAVGHLGFPVRLHYMRLAAQAAFEELSHDGFRVVDYVPIEEAEEEEMHAEVEAEKDEVVESLRYAAEGGDVESTLRLADAYYHGLRHVPIDVDRAAQLYDQAAAAGDERAQIQLAKMELLGQRRGQSNETFLQKIRGMNKTAEGLALQAHLHGTGAMNVPKNLPLATELFRQAAAMPGAGPTVLTNLGLMERTMGQRAAAFSHLTLAASRHDVAASYWLGEMVYGENDLRNSSEAFLFFGTVVRRQLLRVFWPRMVDAFLAGNFSVALRWTAALSHAGLCEVSWDGVMMMQRALDRFEAVPKENFAERKRLEKRFASEALRNYHPQADVDFAEMQLTAAQLGVYGKRERRTVLEDLFFRRGIRAALFELVGESEKEKEKEQTRKWEGPLLSVVLAEDADAAQVSTAIWYLCVLHPAVCAGVGAVLGAAVAIACV